MSYIKFLKSQKTYLILIAILILTLILKLILITRNPNPKTRQIKPQLQGCEVNNDTVCYSLVLGQNSDVLSLVEATKLGEISSLQGTYDKSFFRLFRLIDRAKDQLERVIGLFKYRFFNIQKSLEVIQTKAMVPLEENLWGNRLALVYGFVFGNDDQISREVKEKFRLFGLYHILAASGSNLSLWILPLVLIIPTYSRKTSLFLTCVWAIIYFLLLGDNPPVARAVSMLILGQLGSKLYLKQVKRQRLLLCSAIILLVFSSSYISSLSFWMSILATWAIIFFISGDSIWLQYLLGEEIDKDKWSLSKIFLESYQASIAAQLALAPIFIWYFAELSWAGLMVGPLLTPLVEVAVQLSFVLVFLSGATSFWPLMEIILSQLSRFYADLSSLILWIIDKVPIQNGAWELVTKSSKSLALGLWSLVFLTFIGFMRKKPNRKITFFYE